MPLAFDQTIQTALRYLATIEREIARCDPQEAELLGEEARTLAKFLKETVDRESEILHKFVGLKTNVKKYKMLRRPIPS